jgi:hypothetical protein
MAVTAIKFRRKMIKLAVNTEQEVLLPALESGGLAVHRAWNCFADKPSDFYWAISHYSSGMALSTKLRTRKAALAATEKILALEILDWNLSPSEIDATPDYYNKLAPIKAIIENIYEEAECSRS